MAVSRFKTSSVAQGLPKYQKFWDGTTLVIQLIPSVYIAVSETGYVQDMHYFVASTETITYLTNCITTVTATAAAVGNNRVAGYFQEGWSDGGDYSKLSFATQTSSLINNNSTKSSGASISNQGTAGYFAGGNAGGGYLNTISKITYSTDTPAFAGGTVSNSVDQNVGFTVGSTYGYFAAGFTGGSTSSTVDKYAYATETRSTPGNLGTAIRIASADASSTYGYIFGGYNSSSSNINTIQRWNLSTDTTSNSSATLSAARRETQSGGTVSNLYVFGGTEGAQVKTIDKLVTSTETRSTLSATLTKYASGGVNFGVNNRG